MKSKGLQAIQDGHARRIVVTGGAYNSLEEQIADFADLHLRRDLPSRLKKLGEEYGELAEAIANGDRVGARLEAADCGIVLTDIAHLLGCSLSEMMAHKFTIVQERARDGRLPRRDQ